MKAANEEPAVTSSHEDWVPLMELATREVFEMMLGCQLAAPEIAEGGSFDATSMVGWPEKCVAY